MPNTPSPETEFAPTNDRAMIRYLGAGFGHFADAIDTAIAAIVAGQPGTACPLLDLLADAADEAADRATGYLAGEPSQLEVQYFDEPKAAEEPKQLTYVAPAPEEANAD